MGKKIQYIGRYVMDGEVLGKGNFARVELATHGVISTKVGVCISNCSSALTYFVMIIDK